MHAPSASLTVIIVVIANLQPSDWRMLVMPVSGRLIGVPGTDQHIFLQVTCHELKRNG